ncbi:MAG TPA: alpha/beta hydrolase [bacterium]|nr:alpha/beta hydrolase [bacterium]
MRRFIGPLLIALGATIATAEVPPTEANLAYGPDPAQRLDLWVAPGAAPTPLVITIHGGGWRPGGHRIPWEGPGVYLSRGISVARVDYRHVPDHPLPAPVHDVACAIQFLRLHADRWRLDPRRFATSGSSAGGTTALWIALHDDLADPDHPDPVRRQSTRISAALAFDAQTSIEPRVLQEWLGRDVPWHIMIPTAVGEHSMDAVWSRLPELEPLYREFSPIRHLDAEDPPIFLKYLLDPALPPVDANHAIHHPAFGLRFQLRADSVGADCVLVLDRHARTPNRWQLLTRVFGLGNSDAKRPPQEQRGAPAEADAPPGSGAATPRYSPR